jgi:hypothetical protein
MTEEEWLACDDPIEMLEFLRGRATDRKLRLFGCACCRRLWPLLDDRSRRAVEVSEQHADGRIDLDTFLQNAEAAKAAWNDSSCSAHADINAADAVYRIMWNEYEKSSFEDTVETLQYVVYRMSDAACLQNDSGGDMASRGKQWYRNAAKEKEVAGQLLADIIGDPFHPAPFQPTWRTDIVVAIARQAYDSGDFEGLPILADALEEAGCPDMAILDHLRGPEPHVRGCWVVDLLIGKS